jgi:hypothetical protein
VAFPRKNLNPFVIDVEMVKNPIRRTLQHLQDVPSVEEVKNDVEPICEYCRNALGYYQRISDRIRHKKNTIENQARRDSLFKSNNERQQTGPQISFTILSVNLPVKSKISCQIGEIHIISDQIAFLYDNTKTFTMIKQIGLIAVVAIGLALLIPGTNVQAIISHHSHLHSTGGIGLGIGAIAKFKAHKDNPTQIHLCKGGAPMPYC